MKQLQLYEYLDVAVPVGSDYLCKLLDNLSRSKSIDDEGCEFAVHTLDLDAACSVLRQVLGHLQLTRGD